jgi:hypothetical protein
VIVGYARVSTDGQTLDAQQSALAAAGAEKVFAEKVSGAVTDRKALTRAIAALDAGDVLLVTRPGPAGAQHQGPPQRAGRGGESRCGVSVVGGCLGRYDDTARAADAYDAGRPRRVREKLDPRPHQRRPDQGKSPGRKVWPEACAHRAPAGGSVGASRSWRGLYRNRPQLRGEPLDYFAAERREFLLSRSQRSPGLAIRSQCQSFSAEATKTLEVRPGVSRLRQAQ